METVYYNFYSFQEARASGGEDRRALLVRERAPEHRTAPEGKVISLDEYRARRSARGAGAAFPAEPQLPGGHDEGEPAPRSPSRWREALLTVLELAACGAIIAVAVVACAVFLL